MNRSAHWILAVLLLPGLAAPLSSQEEAQDEEELTGVEEMEAVGAEGQAAASADDGVSVLDVIEYDDLTTQGYSDVLLQLGLASPSFNAPPAVGSNGDATIVRPHSIWGLPPDATQFRINGKRRHRASTMIVGFAGTHFALLGSEGSQGSDISTIPYIALERVEMMRHGSPLKHGANSGAGVLNFVLRDDAQGGSAEVRWGEYYELGGADWTVAANAGMPLRIRNEDRGFFNFSAEFNTTEGTRRSSQGIDVSQLFEGVPEGAGGSPDFFTNHGLPEIGSSYKFLYNTALELGDRAEIYSFANYNQRQEEIGSLYRLPIPLIPSTARGLYSTPFPRADRYPQLIADLRPDPDPETAAFVPGSVPFLYPGQYFDPGNQATWPFNSRNPENRVDPGDPGSSHKFLSINEFYPRGLSPKIDVELEDFSFAAGIRGGLESGWRYDLSGVVGRHSTESAVSQTINPQLLAHPDFAGNPHAIPSSYYAGSQVETDTYLNLNVSRDVNLFQSSELGLGLEYGREHFETRIGEEYSWWVDDREGGLLDQGFSGGAANHFGISPYNALDASRDSFGAYAELYSTLTDKIETRASVRYDHDGDYGGTVNGSLSALWQVADPVALRGSLSTAFRAPSVAQSHYSRFGANFQNYRHAGEEGGIEAIAPRLSSSAILPAYHEAAVQLGARPLDMEHYTSFSLGAVIDVGDLRLSLDYFQKHVDDRIHLTEFLVLPEEGSGDGHGTDPGVHSDPMIGNTRMIRFFNNVFDTRTQGVDISARYPVEHSLGTTTFDLSAIFLDTTFEEAHGAGHVADQVHIGRAGSDHIDNGLPPWHAILTATHQTGGWDFMGRLRYYDSYSEYILGTALFEPSSRLLADLEASYHFKNGLSLAAGVQNLFNTYPDEYENFQDLFDLPAFLAPASLQVSYPSINSTFDNNGGFYYFKASYSW